MAHFIDKLDHSLDDLTKVIERIADIEKDLTPMFNILEHRMELLETLLYRCVFFNISLSIEVTFPPVECVYRGETFTNYSEDDCCDYANESGCNIHESLEITTGMKFNVTKLYSQGLDDSIFIDSPCLRPVKFQWLSRIDQLKLFEHVMAFTEKAILEADKRETERRLALDDYKKSQEYKDLNELSKAVTK